MKILSFILGIFFWLAGIGCLLALVVAINWPDGGNYLALTVACVLWGGGALLSFALATAMLVKVFRSKKREER